MIMEFAELHPPVITNLIDSANGMTEMKKMWTELCTRLNSLGVCSKEIKEWKTVSEWKIKTEIKFAKSNAQKRATGRGPNANIVLSSYEDRLLSAMGRTATLGKSSTFHHSMLMYNHAFR